MERIVKQGLTIFPPVQVILLTVTLLLILAAPATAVQHSPPWAHLNSVHYNSHMSSTKLLWAKNWVTEMGYDCHATTNLSSYSVYRWWKDDSLMLFAGHGYEDASGGGGGIVPFDGSSHGFILGEDKQNPSRANNDPVYFVKNYQTNADIGDNLLALFLGCETAKTHSRYGNLLDWARARGTDCAIGFNYKIPGGDNIGVFGMGVMRGARFHNYQIDNPPGYNSGQDTDLMGYGYTYMMANANQPASIMKYWTTKGQYGQRLQPARYGTW